MGTLVRMQGPGIEGPTKVFVPELGTAQRISGTGEILCKSEDEKMKVKEEKEEQKAQKDEP
jgi:hypothetical protein